MLWILQAAATTAWPGDAMRNRLLVLVLVGACSFSADLPEETVPSITVGFETATSNADEKSSVHEIEIVLSEVSSRDVTVKYQVAETTAQPTDFTLPTPETITIPAGQQRALLAVEVKADTVDPEPNETIDFVLLEPDGAQLAAGADHHEVTILAKALPRVAFMTATSEAQEPMDETLAIVLDETSEFPVTVDYTVTSTASAGDDYVLANGTVTFAAGELTKQVVLDVLDDQLDEDDETVTITLTNPTNAFLDATTPVHVHTILDTLVDPPPTIQFQAAASTFAESGAAQNIVVTLSAPSGRTVSVTYAIDAASNASAADITVPAGPLSIPAGATSGNIAVTILQDTADEPTETLEVDLVTPTNATLGAITTHRLSITDDDLVCYGPPNSTSDVCFQTAPTGVVDLGGGSINTDNSALCSTQTIDFGPGQDPACFIVGEVINVNGGYTITGTRPLVLVASMTINVNNVLDGSSKQAGGTGPAANSASCAPGTNPANDMAGAGGGAGGSFMTAGGAGGTGDNGDTAGGIPATADMMPPAKLRGGCAGQKGGNGNGGGAGGSGGGAIYLVSGNTIALGQNAVINVSGAGGSGGGISDGGGGGGSGGMIALYAMGTLGVNNSTKLVANGGGGGAGGTSSQSGAAGNDPVATNYTTPASGGSGSGVNGGNGFAGNTQATGGDNGGSNDAGGGGGGGGGFIYSNKSLGNADASAGSILIAP